MEFLPSTPCSKNILYSSSYLLSNQDKLYQNIYAIHSKMQASGDETIFDDNDVIRILSNLFPSHSSITPETLQNLRAQPSLKDANLGEIFFQAIMMDKTIAKNTLTERDKRIIEQLNMETAIQNEKVRNDCKCNGIMNLIKADCNEYKSHLANDIISTIQNNSFLKAHFTQNGELISVDEMVNQLTEEKNAAVLNLINSKKKLFSGIEKYKIVCALEGSLINMEIDLNQRLQNFQAILEKNKTTIEKHRDTHWVRFIKAIVFSLSCALFWIADISGVGAIKHGDDICVNVPHWTYLKLYGVQGKSFFNKVDLSSPSYELDITSWFLKPNKLLLKNTNGKIAYSVLHPNKGHIWNQLTDIDAPIPFNQEQVDLLKDKIIQFASSKQHIYIGALEDLNIPTPPSL